ncbi:DUF447 domain-containing protein [Methanocaldococcus infernus]
MLGEYVLVCKGSFINKAPIGAYINKDIAKIYLYEGSHTYEILKENNYFSLNVVEPIDLAKALISDEDDYLFNKDIPFLKSSFYSIFYEIFERKSFERKDRFGKAKVMVIKAKEIDRIYFNKVPKPYNRGSSLLVELSVLYSRLIKYEDEELMEEFLSLYKKVKRLGNKECRALADLLLSKLRERYANENL